MRPASLRMVVKLMKKTYFEQVPVKLVLKIATVAEGPATAKKPKPGSNKVGRQP